MYCSSPVTASIKYFTAATSTIPQNPAGDLTVLGQFQSLFVEGVMAQSEGAPQLPVLRQLSDKQTEAEE